MTISFSGLASGLDTSSWITSLTALKQAKVTTLQQQKENLVLSRDTLTSIRSFFTSFRSMIERVTDTRFNVASMDLFAQKLAVSSNTSVLTATATPEAQEGTYEIKVDQLANKTQAVSKNTYTTVIEQTTVATNNSLLKDLGVRAGNISVTVDGIERGIEITNEDTIGSFAQKLKNVGVNAHFNEGTGIFSMDIGTTDIHDIDLTGVVDKLHLEGVNEGYQSGNLSQERVENVFNVATGSTALSDLGVSAGTITIRSNEAEYQVTLEDGDTVQDLLNVLNDEGISANLSPEGYFSISNAVIVSDGTTNLINAFGLDAPDVSKNIQQSINLTTQKNVNDTIVVDGTTLLKDIPGFELLTDNQTVTVKDASNRESTITIGTTTTMDQFMLGLRDAGLGATLTNGDLSITGGTITGGSFDIVDAFNLEETPYSGIVTGSALTETTTTITDVTSASRLVEDLGVSQGYLKVTDSSGNAHYEKIYSGQTMQQFVDDLNGFGISASLDEATGVLTITGGSLETLTDAQVSSLVSAGTISESDSALIKGSDVITKFFGASSISDSQTDIQQASAKSQPLRQSVITTTKASGTTTLGTLGLASGESTATFDVRGNSVTVTVNSTMTIDGLIATLGASGINASFDSINSILSIDNAAITSSTAAGTLGGVLGLTNTVTSKYVTSTAMYAKTTVQASRTDKISDYVTLPSNKVITAYDKDGNVNGTYTVDANTTFDSLFTALNNYGIQSTMNEGVITFSSNNASYVAGDVLAAMGITTKTTTNTVITTLGVMQSSSTAVTHIDTITAKATDTIASYITLPSNKVVTFKNNVGTVTGSFTVDSNTTFQQLFNAMGSHGITATMATNGVINISSASDAYATGDLLTSLGITTSTTTNNYTTTSGATVTSSSQITYNTTTVAGTGTTISSCITMPTDKNITVWRAGTAVATVSVTNTSKFSDMFTSLGSHGVTGTISNGTVTLSSTNGSYATGSVLNSLGVPSGTTTTTIHTTFGTTVTSSDKLYHSYTTTSVAATGSTISEFITLPSNKNVTIWSNGTAVGTVTVDSTTTFNTFITNLKNAGMNTTSMSNGVLTIASSSGKYATGDVLTSMGVGTATSTTSTTTTYGQTITSDNPIYYTYQANATTLSTISTCITLPSNKNITIWSNGTAVGTVTIDNTTTFNTFLTNMKNAGMDSSSMTNGVVTLSSSSGKYATGDVLTNMGIGTTTNTTHTTTTIGKTLTSSGALTYQTTSVTPGYTTYTGKTVSSSSAITYTVSETSTVDAGLMTFGNLGIGTGSAHSANTSYITMNSNGTVASGSTVLIQSQEAFEAMSGRYYSNCTLVLDCDVTISSSWSAINLSNCTFDGQGHEITFNNTGVYTSYQSPYQSDSAGLFGDVDGGIVKNLYLSGSIISNSGAKNNGVLAGCAKNYARIENIISCTDIRGPGNSLQDYTGGIVGRVDTGAVIRRCEVSADIVSGAFTGGIAGAMFSASSYIESCIVNNAKVSTQQYCQGSYSGGIVGYLDAGGFSSNVVLSDGYGYSNSKDYYGVLFGKGSYVGQSGYYGYGTVYTNFNCVYEGNYANEGSAYVKSANINEITGGANSSYFAFGSTSGGMYVFMRHEDNENDMQKVAVYDSDTGQMQGFITVGKDTYVSQFNQQLEQMGGTINFSNTGSISISGVAISNDDVINALGLSVDTINTVTNTVNRMTGYVSLTSTSTTTVTMSASSTMEQVFGTGTVVIEYTEGGIKSSAPTATKTVTITSTSTNPKTMQSFCEEFNYVTNSSLTVTVNSDGTLSFIPGTTSKGILMGIKDASGTNISSRVKITLGDTYTKSVTADTTTTVTKTATTATTLATLGLSGNGTIKINATSITIASSKTVGELISAINTAAGSTIASFSSGKLTISGTTGKAVTSISSNLATVLKLPTATSSLYSTSTSSTVTGSNDTSNTLKYTTSATVSTTSTFGVIPGFTANGTITCNDGATITVTNSTKFSDLISSLGSHGITATLSDGKITLTPQSGKWISGVSSNLADVLNIPPSSSSYYSSTVTYTTHGSNDTSDKFQYNYTTSMVATTTHTVGTSGSIVVAGTNKTVTVTAGMTYGSLASALTSAGLTASFSGGKLTISGSEGIYISSITSAVATALKLPTDINSYQSVRTTYTTAGSNGTSSTQHIATFTTILTGATKLGSPGLGLTGTYYITVAQNATAGETVLSFGATSSIDDIKSQLSSAGITLSYSSGKVTVGSSGSKFIKGMSSELAGALKLNVGNGYTYTEQPITEIYGENSNSAQQTRVGTINMYSGTTFSQLALTTEGRINIKDRDQGDISIVIEPNSQMTIGQFVEALQTAGLTGSKVENGKIYIAGDNNTYVASITDNLAQVLHLSSEGTDYRTTQSDQTVSGYNTNSTMLQKVKVEVADEDNTLAELTNSAGTSLGITAGKINVVSNGSTIGVDITTGDTLETLKAKFSQYGINVTLAADGKMYMNSTGNNYLTTDGISSGASNILSVLGLEDEKWTATSSSKSQVLQDVANVNTVITGTTKMTDLLNTSGTNMGITTGEYIIYSNGVKNYATINANTTVADFISELGTYGITANIASDGSITVSGKDDSYITSSDRAGGSNVVSTLFPDWKYINQYKSNKIQAVDIKNEAIDKNTKLGDINEGTFQEGYITVVKDGAETNISLSADTTVGELMDSLSLYGFETILGADGKITVKSSGDLELKACTTASPASNILDIMNIQSDKWINTNHYNADDLSITNSYTVDVAVSRDTLLSDLGVTTGEYNIFNNGVKYTALISYDETVGSFLDTLERFGVETSINVSGNRSEIRLTGNGNVYLEKSASATNASNIVDVLFPSGKQTSFDYGATIGQAGTVTTEIIATEDTLLSAYNQVVGGSLQSSTGKLSVTVDGIKNVINITSDETFGSLINKFQNIGIDASLSKDGVLTIQSGFAEMTINADGTTSNLLTNLGLAYSDDLGGYMASSQVCEQTVTIVEEREASIAKHADFDTQMGLLNISSGSLSIYRDGQKAIVQIDSEENFSKLSERLRAAFSEGDVDIRFNDGYLEFYSTTDGVKIEVGATTDTSNLCAIAGLSSKDNGAISSRELYKVNGTSKITGSNLFRLGDITEGTFTVGNATFEITSDTTLNNLISQINSSQEANATAFWDSVDGKLTIKSRLSGATFVNIEAGTSNFTDIMGYTTTERDANGDITSTKLNVNSQELGQNAKFTINGTEFTSTSNTITSDISRIAGVTIDLKGVSEGETVTLKIEKDGQTVSNAMEDIVNAYNDLITNVDKELAAGGGLEGESTLKLLRNQIRSLMTSSLGGNGVFKNFDAIGISTEAASAGDISTGNINLLHFDSEKFLKAYETDASALKQILVGDDNSLGILSRVENVLESALTTGYGYFSSAEKSFNSQISRLDDKINKANAAVERYRSRLETKFQAMDMLISKMQNQYSSFLGV